MAQKKMDEQERRSGALEGKSASRWISDDPVGQFKGKLLSLLTVVNSSILQPLF